MSHKNFKDEFWFSHASDAKDDPKCMLLIEQLGLEGYGIFWILVEVLRQQKNYKYPIALLSPLSRKYNTTQAKMEVVVKDYGLFELDEESFFFSYSLNRRMEALEQAKEKKRLAGVKSGQARRKKKIEQCSNSVQSMLEHKSNGSELTYNNITYNNINILEDDEEEDVKLKRYLQYLSKNEIKLQEILSNFIEFITMGDKSLIKNRFLYAEDLKNKLFKYDKRTIQNFKTFLKNQEVVSWIKQDN